MADENLPHHKLLLSDNLASAPDWTNREQIGHHLVIDLFGCNPEKMKIVDVVEAIMLKAAKAAKATIVGHKFHQFLPTGVSGAIVLAESHLAIHTWPEVDGYCAIDIFTCGKTDNFAALEVLRTEFEAKRFSLVEIGRGKIQDIEKKEQRVKNSNAATSATVRAPFLFAESLDPLNGFKASIMMEALLESVQSPFQKVEMYQAASNQLDKVLVLDGIIQLTSYDNAAYHEMVAHVPMNVHPNPKKVLIIGGGDGGALTEFLKYQSVEEVIVCDIDQEVEKMTRKYFPIFDASFKDARVRTVYQDGAQFIKNFKNYFDVIVMDTTDFFEAGSAKSLLKKDFYQNIYEGLTEDGIAVAQSESLYYDREFVAKQIKQNSELFPVCKYYYTLVPTYPSGSIGFTFNSKKYLPSDIHLKEESILNDLEYYTPEIHQGSFALPKFLMDLIK